MSGLCSASRIGLSESHRRPLGEQVRLRLIPHGPRSESDMTALRRIMTRLLPTVVFG